MVKGVTGQMRLIRVGSDGLAECIEIDHDGFVRRQFHDVSSLRPMRDVFRPRSAWLETSAVDVLAIEREEQAAAEAKRAQRRAARKAKKSKKAFKTAVAA